MKTALDDGDDESAVILLEQKESLEDSVEKLEAAIQAMARLKSQWRP